MTNSEVLSAINAPPEDVKNPVNPQLLLLLSVALYFLIGAYRWNLESALLIVVAVFIHECGHLAAMKVYKYKNLKMLFIPFLGAAASGRPDEQNSYKIAIISVSGPLVGLISAGAALLIWLLTKNPIFIQFAYLAVVLNAFNLLPIMPLDGGYFWDEVLFAKFPRAQFAFKVVAVAALLALAARKGMAPLVIIAAVMITFLKVSYKMALAVNLLRTEPGMREGGLTEEKVAQIRERIGAANGEIEKFKNSARLPGAVAAAWAKVNKVFPTRAQAAQLISIYIAIALVVTPVAFEITRGIATNRFTVAYSKKGNSNSKKGDFGAALADYNRAVALAPKPFPVVYFNRGVARFATGNIDGAIADFDHAIELDGKTPSVFYFRGLAKDRKGDYAGAIADFDVALSQRPGASNIYIFRGSAETMEGMLPAAVGDLDRAIAKDPKNGDALWRRGFAKDLEGDFPGAVSDYGKALAILPKEYRLRIRLMLVIRRQHLDDGPLKLRASAGEIKDPWFKAVMDYLAGGLSEPELLARARSGATDAERRQQSQAFYFVGMTHLLKNESKEARSFFTKCVAFDFNDLGEDVLAHAELNRLDSSARGQERK